MGVTLGFNHSVIYLPMDPNFAIVVYADSLAAKSTRPSSTIVDYNVRFASIQTFQGSL